MEIYLLRHGTTIQSGTYTGRSDVELSADGEHQILSLAPRLKSVDFDACFCSPLKRCRQTLALLDIIAECNFVESLKEIDFGLWEGLSFKQIQNSYPDQLDSWARQGDDFRFPGGERIKTFNSRIIDWFDKLLTKDFNRVLIVAHGGVVRTGICHLVGIDSTKAFVFNPKEGRVAKISVDDGFGQLEYFNCADW